MDMLRNSEKCGIIFSVNDNGFIVCPKCGRAMHGIRVTTRTSATALMVRCKTCREEYRLDINSGQCSSSQRP